jgi:spermidine/putrescine transport system substrate-binding protein
VADDEVRSHHPKERRGVSRRALLRGAATGAVGLGAAGALASCANTTTAVGDCGDGSAGAGASGLAAQLVEPKPLGPGGLPLPRTDNSVTWKITSDNEPIPDKRPSEGGTLRIFNYPDYLDPITVKAFEARYKCKTATATYNSADEAYSKLASGSVNFDVVVGLSANMIVRLMARGLIQPLNHSYLPNLKSIWEVLQDPFYDGGGRYTVPYVVWADGIGWRNDKLREDVAKLKVPWDIFWEGQAYKGRVGLLDDNRDALSMPMQRDAMRAGVVADLNTEDPKVIAKAGQDLAELTRLLNIKVTITDYQTLPEATTWLHHSWSGDLIAAALYYMPEGTKPDVLSFWGPETGGVVQNDFMFIPSKAAKPALAHRFLDFMLEEKNAYNNFVNQNGYVPPQQGIDAASLIKDGLIPESLAPAVTKPDQFAANQELLALTSTGTKLWENAWSKFKAG